MRESIENDGKRWSLLLIALAGIAGSMGQGVDSRAGDSTDPNAFVECRARGRAILMRRRDCNGADAVIRNLKTRDSTAPPAAVAPSEPVRGSSRLAPDEAARILGEMPLGVAPGQAVAWWGAQGARCARPTVSRGNEHVSCAASFLGGPAKLWLSFDEGVLTYASLDVEDLDSRLERLVRNAGGRWPDDRHMSYEAFIEKLSKAMNAQFGPGSDAGSGAKTHGFSVTQNSAMRWGAQDRSLNVEQTTTISGGAARYEIKASVFATAVRAQLDAREDQRRNRMRAILDGQ